jgi:isoquinoline 1-oxidoreductase subunit alpha
LAQRACRREEGAVEIKVNGKNTEIEVDSAMPLLWVLRDVLNLTGTKFGCGIAACGACTALVDGQAVRTCVTPVGSVAGKQVRTIEDLGGNGLHALQQAWIDKQVPQCGYCQSGMLMAAAALLSANPSPSDAQIDAAISNICRCGTYQRVRAAIRSLARVVREGM